MKLSKLWYFFRNRGGGNLSNFLILFILVIVDRLVALISSSYFKLDYVFLLTDKNDTHKKIILKFSSIMSYTLLILLLVNISFEIFEIDFQITVYFLYIYTQSIRETTLLRNKIYSD